MSIDKVKTNKEQYDGVHFLVFFSIAVFCDYINFGDIIFQILFIVYFVISFYFLEKWTKEKIFKQVALFLLLFVIGKIINFIF